MKKTTRHLAFLALAALFVVTSSGIAEARGYGNRGGGPWYGASAMTQEQQTKAQQIMSAQYEKMAPVKQQMIVKQAELQAQMISPAPDKAKIESLAKEIGALKGKMLAARSDAVTLLKNEGVPIGGGFSMGPGRGRGMGPGRGMGNGMGPGRGMGGGMGRGMGPGAGW